MANDVVFKSSFFGGFNKEEVMAYINTLLSEKKNLEEQVSSANAKVAQYTVKMNSLELQVADAEKFVQQYNMLTAENIALRNQLGDVEALKRRYEELRAEVEREKAECDVMRAELNYNNGYKPKDIEALKAENARLKADNARMRGMEQQVGAAMLDARLHSEELVTAAREKANRVTRDIYSAIGDTALKIDGLSSEITEIASSFTKSAEEIELRINVLTGNMSKTAQALISDNNVLQNSAPDDGKAESDSADSAASFGYLFETDGLKGEAAGNE